MGFGSYDEDEQRDATVDADESDGVNVHEKEHDGEIEFETNASTDELLDRLDDIKSDE